MLLFASFVLQASIQQLDWRKQHAHQLPVHVSGPMPSTHPCWCLYGDLRCAACSALFLQGLAFKRKVSAVLLERLQIYCSSPDVCALLAAGSQSACGARRSSARGATPGASRFGRTLRAQTPGFVEPAARRAALSCSSWRRSWRRWRRPLTGLTSSSSPPNTVQVLRGQSGAAPALEAIEALLQVPAGHGSACQSLVQRGQKRMLLGSLGRAALDGCGRLSPGSG